MPKTRFFPQLLTVIVIFLSLTASLYSQESAIRYQTTGIIDGMIGGLFFINNVEIYSDGTAEYFDISGNAITESDFKAGMIVNAIFDQYIDTTFGDERNLLVKLTQIETGNLTRSYEGIITELESHVMVLDDTFSVGISDAKFFNESKEIKWSDLETGTLVRAAGIRTTSGLRADQVDFISDGTGHIFTFTDYITAINPDSMTVTVGDKRLDLPADVRITLGKTRWIPQSALQLDLLISAKATKLGKNYYRIDSLFLGQLLGLELIQEIHDDYLVAEDFKFPIIPQAKVFSSDGSVSSLSEITPGSFCALYSMKPDFADPNSYYRIGVIVIEKADFKFILRGTVDEKHDSTLVVHGFKITTNDGTQVYKGVLEIPSSFSAINEGNYVEMIVQRIFQDGQFIALEIKVSDDISETKFEYGGVVDSVNFAGGSLVISGIQIETTPQTLIVDKNDNKISLDEIQPKFFAFVAGSTLEDGRNIAQTIRIINDAFLEYDASGPVTAKDNESVSIGSLRLMLTSETSYSNIKSIDEIKVGDFIRVMYYYLPDKSVKAIWIELSDETSAPVHQMGRIDSILTDGFISSGLRFRVNDSTEFSDEHGNPINFTDLKQNASVIVEGDWNFGSDIVALYVMQRQVVFLRAVFRSATATTALIGNQNYVIDSSTAIIDIDGKSIKLSDLLPGSVVEVTASTEVNGVKTAQRIQVQKRGTASGIAEEFTKQTCIEILPNPVSSTAKMNYRLEKPGRVIITMTDMSGQKISTLFDGGASSGTQNLEWNCSSLSSGTYFITLSVGGKKTTHTFQVLK
ncbi:MAG: T9SS type A sorting domain-containing protein [Ignavibacteriae bacterium]|nr:T9SS type A sorting domain-containing protein [Ignavibacteriota bacterium]